MRRDFGVFIGFFGMNGRTGHARRVVREISSGWNGPRYSASSAPCAVSAWKSPKNG